MDKRNMFLEELNALLEKYDVEISCDDHWEGYPECGEDLRITVDFDDYKISEIEFGKYLDCYQIKKLLKGES